MEKILIPEFLVSKKDREVFDNVDLFGSLVGQIGDYTHGRIKSLKDIMKTLAYLRRVKGLPTLNEAFACLKEFVFELYKSEGSNNNNASTPNSACLNTMTSNKNNASTPNSAMLTSNKVLNKTVCKELDMYRCLLEAAVKRHTDLIKQLQTLQKTCLTYQEKQKKYQEKLETKMEQPEAEMKKSTQKEIVQLQKKNSLNRELTDKAYLSYQSVLEKEKYTRREMQQLSDVLQQQVIARARDKLAEASGVLEDLAKSNDLSIFLLDKIKSVDCQYVSEQLYKHICKAYVFPDPEEWNLRTGFHVNLQDPALICSDFCHNNDELSPCQQGILHLADIEEPDRPEEVYVKATTNCKKGSESSLTFKRGNLFKQKLTSTDGTLGFGWKRSSRTGMKMRGFYQTYMVKFDHFPKK